MKTNSLKKVLIAIDYDPTAQKIAESGYELAKALNAEITLLHVVVDAMCYTSMQYTPIMGFEGFNDFANSQLFDNESIKTLSLKFLDKIKHHLGDDAIKTIVAEGDFAETIKLIAKSIHTDIIVIGSHSRSWLENTVMGSVTESVLHNTTIPLFIIPTKKPK